MTSISFLRALESTDSGVITAMSPQLLIGPLLGFYESSSLLALYLMIGSLKSSNNFMWKYSNLSSAVCMYNISIKCDMIIKTNERMLLEKQQTEIYLFQKSVVGSIDT